MFSSSCCCRFPKRYLFVFIPVAPNWNFTLILFKACIKRETIGKMPNIFTTCRRFIHAWKFQIVCLVRWRQREKKKDTAWILIKTGTKYCLNKNVVSDHSDFFSSLILKPILACNCNHFLMNFSVTTATYFSVLLSAVTIKPTDLGQFLWVKIAEFISLIPNFLLIP